MSLDVVRGVAVMGILTMNIASFAMVFPAYFNPLATGDASLADRIVYCLDFVLFDGKMRGLFSLLFGASMLVVIERADARGANAAKLHAARMAALFGFGLLHLWLFWWGDILAHYALVGMIAFLFHPLPARLLVAIGVALVAAQCWTNYAILAQINALQAMLADPGSAPRAAAALTRIGQSFGTPSGEWVAEQVALHRGPYTELFAHRFARHGLGWWNELTYLGPETLAYMLFGMAALKTGLLRGAWPRRRVRRVAAISFALTIPVYTLLAIDLWRSDFAMRSIVANVIVAPTPFRLVMILGWACLILAAMTPGGWLTTRVAAAGRMAFTNYLATTLICTTLFYGHGFGWFGMLDRVELWGVVVATWIAMLAWSAPWLARFRYGPMEWVWRSLSRGRITPFRIAASAT